VIYAAVVVKQIVGEEMGPVMSEFRNGWVPLVAAILQYVTGYPGTILPLSGILFGPKYEKFKTSETEKAVTTGLFIVFMNLVSIFVGPMVKARSSRFVATIATFCQVFGLIVCAFSNSSYMLMVGFGILVGTGVGLSFVNNIIIVQKSFKSTSLAFGLALTIISLLGVAIPPVTNSLISYFKQQGDLLNQWTILVYSGFSCIGFLGAHLMAPQPGILVPSNEESVPESGDGESEDSELIKAFKEFSDLLKDPIYVVTAIVNSCHFSVMVYFISLLERLARVRDIESYILVTIFTSSNVAALLPMGLVGDTDIMKRVFEFPRKALFILCGFGLTFTIIIISLSSDFKTLIVGTILTAIFSSGMFVTTNLVYEDCFKTKFANAVGLSNLSRCIFSLAVTYVAGYINSLSGCQDLLCCLDFLSGTSGILLLLWVGLDLAQKMSREGYQFTNPT